jgi:hypothetical protein
LIEFSSKLAARQLFGDISKSPQHYYALYVLENTDKQDKVYFWGNETKLNFLTQRQSPTKYIYTYPLFIPTGYVTTAAATRFAQDIANSKPMLIDTRNEFVPALEELDVSEYPYLQDFITLFQSSYKKIDVVGPDQWIIYEYVEP